jgi:septal ring factor EnvC (AmiA/AmiB activator)
MEAEQVKTESKMEMDEAQKLWQDYLQRCCEVGQIRHQLDQLDSQRKEIEKNLDITERKVRSTAQQHRDLQKALAAKVQMPKPETETKESH